MNDEMFPGFPYRAVDLARFIQVKELFTCLLRNRRIIHFCPEDVESFKNWLLENGIPDGNE